MGGYHLVFLSLRYNAGQKMITRLDNNEYADEETFVSKIPMVHPYLISYNNYVRVDGTFEYAGEYFRLVKQKLENDTLYIVYIKDHRETHLVNLMNQFNRFSNESSSHEGYSLLPKFVKDIERTHATEVVQVNGWSASLQRTSHQLLHVNWTATVPSPPPDQLLS